MSVREGIVMCDCVDAAWGTRCPNCGQVLPPPVDPAAPYSWHARRGYDEQTARNAAQGRNNPNRVQPVASAFNRRRLRAVA